MANDIEKELKEEEKEVKSEKVEMQMEAPKSENPHLRVRPVLIFWAVVVVLFTAVLFFVIGLKYGDDNSTNSSTSLVTATVSPAASASATDSAATTTTADVTASWKTYTNDTYGFSFKYPNDWTTEEAKSYDKTVPVIRIASPETTKAGGGYEGPAPFDLSVYYYSTAASIDSKYSSILDYMNDKTVFVSGYNSINFAGQTAYDATEPGMGSYYTINLDKNSHIFKLFFDRKGTKADLSPTENQILSTFQFTK